MRCCQFIRIDSKLQHGTRLAACGEDARSYRVKSIAVTAVNVNLQDLTLGW